MKITLIEESKAVSQIIQSILQSNGYDCDFRTHKTINYEALVEEDSQIFLINVNSANAYDILSKLKSISNDIIVIGISTKATWKEKVLFLNSGAEDVIDYPFPIQELMARIEAVGRRLNAKLNRIIRTKDIEIDTGLKMVKIKDKEVKLRRKEYDLLEYMVQNSNRTVTRTELLDHVWDYKRLTASNTVDVHVKRLRDKLPYRDYIKTIHGFGYTIKGS